MTWDEEASTHVLSTGRRLRLPEPFMRETIVGPALTLNPADGKKWFEWGYAERAEVAEYMVHWWREWAKSTRWEKERPK
jgi:hypothetical protein